MGNNCCTDDRTNDLKTQQFNKVRKMNEQALDNLGNNSEEVILLDPNDPRVSEIDKRIDQVNSDTFLDLKTYFKTVNASIDVDALKKHDAYCYGKDSLVETDLSSIYKGSFGPDNHIRQGFGALLIVNGDFFIGQCKNNLANGAGVLIKKNGDWYKGNLYDNQFNGFGSLYQKEIGIYNGHFVEDLKEGKGKYVYYNELCFSYEGDFKNDNRHGKGKICYTDDSFYDGDFFNDQLHGYGFYSWSDGKFYDGYWIRGKMETPEGKVSTFRWSDGAVYVGEYFNDKKQGRGKFTFAKGNSYDGEWFQGKQHGKGIVIIVGEDGQIKKQETTIWKYGLKVKEKGQLKTQETYNWENAIKMKEDND